MTIDLNAVFPDRPHEMNPDAFAYLNFVYLVRDESGLARTRSVVFCNPNRHSLAHMNALIKRSLPSGCYFNPSSNAQFSSLGVVPLGESVHEFFCLDFLSESDRENVSADLQSGQAFPRLDVLLELFGAKLGHHPDLEPRLPSRARLRP